MGVRRPARKARTTRTRIQRRIALVMTRISSHWGRPAAAGFQR
jgi:hypothetical protein